MRVIGAENREMGDERAQDLMGSRRCDAALVVMARYPTPGRVKTRLACAIGATAACDLHRAFIDDIGLRFGGRQDVDLVWAFEPADADFAAVVGKQSRAFAQAGDALGERMRRAFEHLFRAGYDHVVMIGADIPHVADETIAEALQLLRRSAVVLGPSDDGGYYLVAMNALHDIFDSVPMGTAEVFAETVRRVEARQLTLSVLPRSFDIDEVGDLRRLRDLMRTQDWAQKLPATARCLGTLAIPVE